MDAEIIALQSAIKQYGSAFAKLVVGISVGSEDLYRNSPTGIAAKSGYGADPDTIVGYIKQVKAAIANTPLSGAPIGHVDTWTAWANSSNSVVADACDWVGMDAYPYFQSTMANSIEAGPGLFNDALDATKAAVGGKPVWITETGWPVTGSTQNQGVPSTANAKKYWDEVGCPNFGKTNIFWFTLQDAAPVTPNPSFGIVGSTLSSKPLFDVSCDGVSTLPSTTAPTGSATGTSSAPAKTASSSAGLTPSEGNSSGSGTASSAPSNISSSSPTCTSNTCSPSGLASTIPAGAVSSGSPTGPSYGSSPNGSLPNGSSGPSSGPATSSSSVSGAPGSPANATATGSPTGTSGSKGSGSASGTGSASGASTTSAGPSANGASTLFAGPFVGALAAAVVLAVTL